jgi:acyl dehydratase
MGPTADRPKRPGAIEAATVIPLDQLPKHTGRHLGYSTWQRITQVRINRFAAVTGDQQWIHVCPQRAARGPFGASVAHGFLTLALFPPLLKQILRVHGASLVVNYGLNRLRFPAPLVAGASTRLGVQLVDAEQRGGGMRTTFGATFEVRGQAKPACVAEVVFCYYP